MNLQQLPREIRMDIEDQSLTILKDFNEHVIVIGGWAVRALAGEKHARTTLDIDGVASAESLEIVRNEIEELGLECRDEDWGVRLFKDYEPVMEITDDDTRKAVKEVELRIEISGKRIQERDSHHYFEFDLEDWVVKEIGFHNSDTVITVRVPPVSTMAANKLGLPVDYKNNFDAAVLLQICELDEVITTIEGTDDWREMVIGRIPKLRGRMSNPERLENILSLSAGVDIDAYIDSLDYFESKLKN
jgi:hypothetical protein